MSVDLQLPGESSWFDNVTRTLLETIRAQWSPEIDDVTSNARSNWLLEQLDIRQWGNHYRIEGRPEIVELRFRGLTLALAMQNSSVPQTVKDRYWNWLQNGLIAKVKQEQPQLFAAIVRQIQSTVIEASEVGIAGDENEG
jgi:hypothetical protein